MPRLDCRMIFVAIREGKNKELFLQKLGES